MNGNKRNGQALLTLRAFKHPRSFLLKFLEELKSLLKRACSSHIDTWVELGLILVLSKLLTFYCCIQHGENQVWWKYTTTLGDLFTNNSLEQNFLNIQNFSKYLKLHCNERKCCSNLCYWHGCSSSFYTWGFRCCTSKTSSSDSALLPAKKRKSYFRPQRTDWSGAKGQQTLHMPGWE